MAAKLKLPHPLILIIGIGCLLYARSFFFDYTNFDDNTLIYDNQGYISDISNLADAFKKTVFITGSDIFYRPIETVWFILNAQLGGADLFVYHFSAFLLHCLAVYLIFLLLKRLNNSEDTSLFLSLIFLVHPVLTQAVAWVPGVVDILVTIFSIASFFFFLDFVKYPKRKYFVLHLLFFALALYTKEIAIGVIPVCICYLYFIEKPARRATRPGSGNLILYNNKVFLTGWVFICALWFVMRDAALQNQAQKGIAEMIKSMLVNLPGFIQYAGKILLPFNLSVMPVMKDTIFVFGVVSLLLFAAAFFISKQKRNNWILFSVTWFVVFLLPTFISTSLFRVHQFYEHRMYLPMVGVLLFAAQVDQIKSFTIEKISNRIAALIVIASFFILTFRHEQTFSDTKTFLDNAVKTAPGSSLAHRNMGIYYQSEDEKNMHKDKQLLYNAANEYIKSLELNPQEKDLHANLGVIYDMLGNKDLAEKEYLTETKMNPANSQAFHNLGLLYSERNENEKAEAYFNQAIKIRPVESTLQELALLYKKMGRQKDFERIIEVLQKGKGGVGRSGRTATIPNPLPVGGNISLALQLMQSGQMQEAETVFKKELMNDSLNTQALFNLGLIYYSAKRLEDAEVFWRKVVLVDSTYTDAFNNLAICLAQQGKKSEAESVLKKLISSNPDYIDGYFNIANFYARNHRDNDALIYVHELKKRGITKQKFEQRGVKLSAELEKLFDADW